MQRLILVFLCVSYGCGAYHTQEVTKDRQEALKRIHRRNEGLQRDGGFVACYPQSQMAHGQSSADLIKIAEFHASQGFLEAMEASSHQTLASGYESALVGQWACSCFKGWSYVVQK